MKIEKKLFVKDIQDKENIKSVFLVKHAAIITDKNGKAYMNLILSDKSGEVESRIWNDVPRASQHAVKENFVQVEAKCQLYQGRRQLVIQSIQFVREDEVDLKDYVVDSNVPVEKLYEELVTTIKSMTDPHYKALAESCFIEDADIKQRILIAPAAKSVHHAYRGGLLEHMVSITKVLNFMASHYGPYVDRDLLFLGGFFHDIGKIWELSYDKVTDYTTEGRLIGHLVMGTELVDRKIRELESIPGRLPSPFPNDKRLLIKHVILSHHGKLEYGSPKRPKCLEAWIVHSIDDLDSKIGAIVEFYKTDLTQGRWTQLNKAQERFFYKPDWAVKQPSEQM